MKFKFSLFIFLFLSFAVSAQDPENPASLEFSFINDFTKENDSYSRKCFSEVWIDPDGRMWFTPCGVDRLINGMSLYRFDGYEFTPFEIKTKNGLILQSPDLNCMDEKGNIYGLSEQNELYILNTNSVEATLLSKSQKENQFWRIVSHGSGIFVLSKPNGTETVLYEIVDNELRIVERIPLMAVPWQSEQFDVRINDSEIWLVSSDFPVLRFDRKNKSLSTYTASAFEKILPKPILKMELNLLLRPIINQDFEGNIYYYNPKIAGNQILTFNRNSQEFETWKNKFNIDWAGAGIFKDEKGNFLFLFLDSNNKYKALIKGIDNAWHICSSGFSTIENIVNIKSHDFLDKFIVLTTHGALHVKLRAPQSVTTMLNGNWVSSMFHINDSILYANTVNDGWFLINEKKKEETPIIVEDEKLEEAFGIGMKQQIISDNNEGIYMVQKNNLIYYHLQSNEIKTAKFDRLISLFEPINDTLIAAKNTRTSLRFYQFNHGFKGNLNFRDSLVLDGFIRDLMIDSKGILWVPTNKGLYQIHPQNLNHSVLTVEDGFSDFRFTSIFEDKVGNIWAGTYFGGLHKYDRNTGEVLNINWDKGLSNNTVMGIISDDDYDLWVSTEYGLNIISQSGEIVNSVYEEDGLASDEFQRFDPYKSKDGKLYFGSRNGISKIDPELLKKELKKDSTVQIYLTEIKYYDKEIGTIYTQNKAFDELEVITLAPDHPYIQIKFGLSGYVEAHKNKYAYKLEGIDDEWTFIGNQNELKIDRLPSGKYKILIKGADFRNNWSKEYIVLNIHAKQYFFKQPWFYLLLSLPFMVFGYLWIRNKQLESNRLELEVEVRTKKIREDKLVIEEQAEKLKALDELKSQFFTNISHELRTPVTLIKAPLENLLSQHEMQLEPSSKNILKLALRNAQKLGKLVEELLDLSSLAANKAQVFEVKTPIVEFCENLFVAYSHGAELKQINFSFHSELRGEKLVLVDRNKLEKVVNNLLSNALKFTPPLGTVKMVLKEENGLLAIQVTDSGRGIPDEDLPHLFERYFQTRRKDIATQGGTGIGLALSKELAVLMGGNLTVESEWGHGSSFTFSILPKFLPEDKDAVIPELIVANPLEVATEKAISKSISNDPKAKQILIVEDNKDMQQLLRSILENEYDCIIANDGREAWEFLNSDTSNKNDIKLIISDIMMPNMDGYEFLAKVKKSDNWMMHPIIMLTARSAEEDKLEALRMGVDDYLLKPFSPIELILRIRNLIKNHEVRRALGAETLSPSQIAYELPPSANLEWLKEVEEAAKEALKSGIKLTTGFLAHKVFISERQFARKLKSITGMTPNDYILEVKLQKARQFLENKVYTTVNEVADACGFSSGSYLTKVYKEHFGIKPSDLL